MSMKRKFADAFSDEIAASINIIPADIEEDILSRVPIKAILRFISVCKSWYSLFLDPMFNLMHKKNSTNTNNLHHVMRLRNHKDIAVTDSSSVVHSHKIAHPLSGCTHHHNEDQRRIVGSCNGIVCIHGLHHCCSYAGGNNSDYLCLWNPALRIKKYIRVHDGPVDSSERAFIGFGFHKESNDYKVIRFEQSKTTKDKQVEIYSLSSDSWRIMKVASTSNMYFSLRNGSTHCHDRAELGVYVNNAYHWAVYRSMKHEDKWGFCTTIFSFDVGEEVFKETIVPIECTENHSNMILFNYNESLAMLTFCRSIDHSPYVWVKNDNGLPRSWTKLCEINVDRSYSIRGFTQEKNEAIFVKDALYYDAQEQEHPPIVFDIDESKVNRRSSTLNIEVLKDASDVMTFKESLSLLGSKNLVHY